MSPDKAILTGEHMAITDWPKNERPRERLLALGAGALSDAELLAIFLRVGVAGQSAVDLARLLLDEFGSLTCLFAADRKRFSKIRGMGDAKYAQLQAVLEMARRALSEDIRERDALSTPERVRDWLRLTFSGLPHEVFGALWLDTQNRLIAYEEISHGTLTQTPVYVREVVKRALFHNAGAVIFAHNHPSGLQEPSRADALLTRSLKEALTLMEVKVLDHFIVIAGALPYSFAEHGLL